MADSSNQDAKESTNEQEFSKASAKRKYLLVDEDLEDLGYELKDNPLNKKYAPMKVFKASDVKRVAIDKWGSLENIEIEQQKRKEKQTNLAEKKENEMRQFWDCEEIYEPMKKFMDKIDLPKTALGEEQSADASKTLLTSDVILCFCDCMNSRPPGMFGKAIYKTFPAASEANKSTPYNDRRKMAHFTWALVNNDDRDQLIVNLYVVHKWNFKSKAQSSYPVLIFGALELVLKRLSKLLVEEWKKISENEFGLSIGTYSPYKVDPEKFNNTIEQSFEVPVQVFTDLAEGISLAMDPHILARFSAFDSHIIVRFTAFRKNVADRFYNTMIVTSILSVMESHPAVDKTIRLLATVLWYILVLSMVPVMLFLLFLICSFITVLFSSTCFLLIIASPWLLPFGSVLLILVSTYVVLRIARTVVAKIYETLQEPLSLQAHYMIALTPTCTPVVRLWRSCLRKGFVQTLASCGSRIALCVPERSIVVLQRLANQPAHCTAIIRGAINVFLTPLVLLVKLGILIICPFVAFWKKFRTTIIGLTTFVKLYICAKVKAVCCRLRCLLSLTFLVFRSILTKILALFLLPKLLWLWFASKVVSEEVLAMGNGEIILEILRKIPVIRNIAVVQRTAEYGVRRANDTLERFVYVRDHVTGEVYCRIRAARDGIHYHLDSYVNLPREVLLLLVRDYLVNGPMDTARRWMQANLEFPFLLQESAGVAINEMHSNAHSHATSNSIKTHKPRLVRHSESEASASKLQNHPSKSRRHSTPASTSTIKETFPGEDAEQ